jgi:hypothetical protein
MLGLLLTVTAAYQVVWRRRNNLLLCFLLPVFGISNLPSELKRYFVLDVAGVYVFPQDVLLGLAIISAVDNRRLWCRMQRDQLLLLLVAVFLIYQVTSFALFTSFQQFQLDYLRMTLFGALWMILVLFAFDVFDSRNVRNVSLAFTAHNVIVVVGAAALLLLPDSNDLSSPLASFIGFSADGFGSGSLILVSASSGPVALIGMWYYLFVERRSVISPTVVLSVLVVVATSHRIDYVALILLLASYIASGRWLRRGSSSAVRTFVLACCCVGTVVGALRVTGVDLTQDVVAPFADRAASLFSGTQSGTINDRLEQYQYVLGGYVTNGDPIKYLFGEGYLPYHLRDPYYQWVQPHNFLLYAFVNQGIIGVTLLLCLVLCVVALRGGWRSRAFLPLCVLMVTQLTDAGFTNYPVMAYLAVLLSLCIESTYSAALARSATCSAETKKPALRSQRQAAPFK